MSNLLLKRKTVKLVLSTLVFALIFTAFVPLLENKAQAKENTTTEQQFYQEQLKANPNFEKDLSEVKLGLKNGSIPNQPPGKVQPRGGFGATLKAIKGLAPVFRHGGTALSWMLKPFSKKAATIAKRNGRKIANAIDNLDKGTRKALENALVKAGVPRSDAKTIVYIIFLII
ncbi:hypothetical protein JOD45_002132 [Scopulibacillus daqui]|uniref:Uncharacterized protein n=1 Tax=Scopulibacillus daqui TaxID=1469162 RepID=A0ABS2Q301_9BACL|nr:hypothetical protein [Scopulibacillus daqui]MBM7645907.1 hypothetical protein [Scopulibacillus daqui]